MASRWRKKYNNMFSRFHIKPACDRLQTDGWMDGRTDLCTAMRGNKNWLKLSSFWFWRRRLTEGRNGDRGCLGNQITKIMSHRIWLPCLKTARWRSAVYTTTSRGSVAYRPIRHLGLILTWELEFPDGPTGRWRRWFYEAITAAEQRSCCNRRKADILVVHC